MFLKFQCTSEKIIHRLKRFYLKVILTECFWKCNSNNSSNNSLYIWNRIFCMDFLKKLYKILIPFYTLFLLYLMFFGFGRSQYDINIVRLIPMFSTVGFIKETILWKTIFVNIFGNILMFVPFGFLGIVFPKLNNFWLLILDFLFVIILIESLQYFTRLGVFDIDDVILNTVGTAIGFWIYQLFDKKFHSRRCF